MECKRDHFQNTENIIHSVEYSVQNSWWNATKPQETIKYILYPRLNIRFYEGAVVI